jgi:SAM-dependent methyltransferase
MDFSCLRDFVGSLSLVDDGGERAAARCLDILLADLTEERRGLSPKEDRAAKAEFQAALFPFTAESPFCQHVYERPRGQHGDYLTQEMIWMGRTGGPPHRYLGATRRGQLLSAFTFDMANCRANEDRVRILRGLIRTAGPRVAGIGCRSAIELWDYELSGLRTKDLFLLDPDGDALLRARAQIGPTPDCATRFHKENLLRFVFQEPRTLLGERDLIYVFGLLDYFTAPQAARILRSLRTCLAPGGKLVATNAHPRNPTRLWMEYGGEWYLNYKDEQTMFDLAAAVPGLADASLLTDDAGVYQYLSLRAAG